MSQAEQPNQTQDKNNSQANTMTPLCKGGCGFYGNSDHGGYCSVCFKKYLTQEQQDQLLANKKNNDKDESKTESKDTSNETNDDQPKKKVQKKKNRCWQCKKKITLAGRFECKCGYTYCSAHRFADAHDCQFDYQAEHKKKLETMNTVIAPSKLNKI